MTEPSEFFRQHHAVDAPQIDSASFRPYWRLRPRLDQLMLDGAITYQQWRAARYFRSLCEVIVASTWRTGTLERYERSDIADSLAIARRVDAGDRLLRVREQLGAWAFALLEAHTVNDESWASLGARFGVHPKTARTWTITAIRALGVVWST